MRKTCLFLAASHSSRVEIWAVKECTAFLSPKAIGLGLLRV